MYKSPRPEHDEPDERDEVPAISYPARRRKSAPASTQQQRAPRKYRTDEQPGKPIARRASLLRERQAQQDLQQEPQHISKSSHPQPRQAPAKHVVSSSRPLQPTRAAQPSHPSRNPSHASASNPSHSAIRPSRRPDVHVSSLRAQPRPIFTRKQLLTGIGITALVLLLLIPLALKASHNSPTTTVVEPASNGTAGVGPSGQPTPDHKLVITPEDLDHPSPPVLATSAYLLDADTGNTLYAYNPFQHLPMLSTTKLMTAMLAIQQQGSNLDQRIIITAAMWRDIGQLSPDSALFGIKQGETYTLRDLLYGLLFVSGNDAAIAIADALGSNLQHFVDEMNAKAQQLGLYDTHFMNPHGLMQAGQYSCAHDLALLGYVSLGMPALHAISSAKAYDIPAGGNHPERLLINENQFMWWYPGVDSGKTGYDGQSDFIQVMSVTRNHHHLIGVVMNTDDWWTDMRDLMNWGFDSFTWVSPRDVDMQHAIPYDSLWNYFAKDTQDVTIPTADGGRYYIYTGFSIDGVIMTYFDKQGGLKTFGYPKGLVKTSGSSLVSQQFEHGTIQCDLSKRQCVKT